MAACEHSGLSYDTKPATEANNQSESVSSSSDPSAQWRKLKDELTGKRGRREKKGGEKGGRWKERINGRSRREKEGKDKREE